MKTLIMCTGLALLAGCGEAENGPLTAEESDQLNEAAAMLDAAPNVVVPADEPALNDQADAPDPEISAQ